MVLIHDDDLEKINGPGGGTVSGYLINRYNVSLRLMLEITGDP